MSEIVEYILSLKDEMSAKISKADAEAEKLHGSMSMLSKAAIGFGVALAGIGLANFVSGSVDMYNDAVQAQTQLTSAMNSTSNAAHLNRKALDEQADALMKKSLFDDDAITSSQALLATFTEVKDKIFMEAIPAITDMSQALKMDLQGATTMVGKALNDPIKGINAMSRAGVSFSESQKDMIKDLVETNHVAEAQTMILKELQTEYGGSAQAASEVGKGPLVVLQHEFDNVRENVGELAMELIVGLKPAILGIVNGIKWLVDSLKDVRDWVVTNKELIKDLGIVVGVTAGVFGIYTIAMNAGAIAAGIYEGVLWLTTAAQWALNAAMTANPIGIVIVAIGAIVAAVVVCWEKFVGFRAVVKGTWEVLKEFASIVGDIFGGIWKQIHGVFTFNPDEIANGFSQTAGAMVGAGQRMASAYKSGFDGEMLASKQADVDESKALILEQKKKDLRTGLKPTAQLATGSASAKPVKATATGSKSITFNIQINDLVKTMNFNVTNIKESASKIKEMVGNALLQSVNDFQHSIPE